MVVRLYKLMHGYTRFDGARLQKTRVQKLESFGGVSCALRSTDIETDARTADES